MAVGRALARLPPYLLRLDVLLLDDCKGRDGGHLRLLAAFSKLQVADIPIHTFGGLFSKHPLHGIIRPASCGRVRHLSSTVGFRSSHHTCFAAIQNLFHSDKLRLQIQLKLSSQRFVLHISALSTQAVLRPVVLGDWQFCLHSGKDSSNLDSWTALHFFKNGPRYLSEWK